MRGMLSVGAILWLFAALGGSKALADAPSAKSAVALSGVISSAAEGKMEGVLVSAQQQGSPISVTVVSDKNGHFEFPAGRLPLGHYALRIRAIGYELDGPQSAEVPAGGGGTVDITLRAAKDIAEQMTSTEWFMSMPGTAAQKRQLIECMSCHTLERIARSKFTADEFVPLLKRMQNYRQQHDAGFDPATADAERRGRRSRFERSPTIFPASTSAADRPGRIR